MIKIYKIDTFEKLEYLLNTLHERGAEWDSGEPLDSEFLANKYWWLWRGVGVCVYKKGKKVTISHIGMIRDAIKIYECTGKEYTIIEDVKLPAKKEIKQEQSIADGLVDMVNFAMVNFIEAVESMFNNSDNSQVEQPSHYIGEHGLEVREIEENFLVRYQDGHLAHLAGALLEYLLRAPSKGKLAEDIQKVKYLANEMAEYVEKVKEAR